MTQVHLFISGFVQGVGYRQFVRKQAQEAGLTGWVKNLPDGRVETILQGSKPHVERVIQACRKGPFLAEVEDIEALWEKTEKIYSNFSILTF